MFPPFLQSLAVLPTLVVVPQERRILQSWELRFGSAEHAKTGNEVLAYGIEYSGDLALGDTLTSVSWAAPSAITLSAGSINATPVALRRRTIPAGQLAIVMIGGGTVNRFYDITNLVTTAQGETLERRFRLQIKNTLL